MRITFTQFANLQVSGRDGTVSYTYQAGETAEVPDGIAGVFIAQGIATATVERATAPRGTRATRPAKKGSER